MVKIPRKPAEWFSGAVFARNCDHSRGLGFIFRIQIHKSLFARPVLLLCVSSLWVNQNRPLQQQRRDIFSRARTRPSGRKRHFFSIERDADRNAFDFPNLRRYVARRTTTSSGSKTSRKQSTSPVFRRTSSTRRAWCFLTNARIREVKTARVNGLRL